MEEKKVETTKPEEQIKEIVIDTGRIKFALRDKTTKELYGVISFNPTDFNILKRFEDARKKIQSATEEITKEVELNSEGKPLEITKETSKIIDKVNNLISKQIDYIFDAEISNSVFGNTSPLAMIKGKLFFENFLEAVYPVVDKEIRKNMEETDKKTSKYTSKYKKR